MKKCQLEVSENSSLLRDYVALRSMGVHSRDVLREVPPSEDGAVIADLHLNVDSTNVYERASEGAVSTSWYLPALEVVQLSSAPTLDALASVQGKSTERAFQAYKRAKVCAFELVKNQSCDCYYCGWWNLVLGTRLES